MANFAIQKEVLAKNVTRVMEVLEKQGEKHDKESKKIEEKVEKQRARGSTIAFQFICNHDTTKTL